MNILSTDPVNPDVNKVSLRDFDGNLVSRFYQYGVIDWEQFYDCLRTVICASTDPWAVFVFDENAPGRHGSICRPSQKLPVPGVYVVLSPDGTPITVNFTEERARPRHPTTSNTATRSEHYRRRVRERDPCCLLSRYMVLDDDYSRFSSAHIFPRAHSEEWVRKGFPSLITDPASLDELGGSTKIDSLQNVVLLRSDLHNAWDNYRVAVNPDRGYVIVPFVAGYDDVAGKTLHLNHIQNINIRPLDQLFRDHFLQAVLKNMKGAGEPNWDYDDALGGGSMDLSRSDIWGGEEGREHLEFELAHRLHSLVSQES